jgi:hypothetical protein
VFSIEVHCVDMPMKVFSRTRITTTIFSPVSLAGRDETADAIENILAPALLGADPHQARRARITMDEAAPGLFKPKSALDIACLFAGD